MSSLTAPTTSGSPRPSRRAVLTVTAIAGVVAVGVVAVPRLTTTSTTTSTGTSSVPVVGPTGLGGGAPSPREVAAAQRAARSQPESLGSGIRAMDPRAWASVAAGMAAAGTLPKSPDAAERWLSSASSPSVVVAPTTPDVAERRALGTGSTDEPGPPRGMQRPRG